MVQLLYDENIAGLEFESSSGFYSTDDFVHFVAVSTSFDDRQTLHILTGFYFEGNNHTWFQDTSGFWVTGGWTYEKSQKTGDAQNLVNQIIKNNKKIYENNLLCAAASKYMTVDDLRLLQNLQNRLLVRNQALEDKNLISNVKLSYPDGYINLLGKLEALMNQKIGIAISTTAMIVISAIVLVSVSAAAYFAYIAFAAESADDVKFSDELTAKLISKLSAEELQMLYEETEGIVTSTRLKEKFGTIAGFGSTLLWIIGGGLLVYWWNNRK